MECQDALADEISKKDMFHVFRSLGITLLVLSLATIASSIFAVAVCCLYPSVGSGIWCSPFVMVTGIMLILLSKFNSSCMASWTSILVVISEIFLLCLMGLEVWAILESLSYGYGYMLGILHFFILCLALAQFTLCTCLLVLFLRTCCSTTSNLSFYDAFAQCCQNGTYMKHMQQHRQQPLMLYGFPPSTPQAAQLQA